MKLLYKIGKILANSINIRKEIVPRCLLFVDGCSLSVNIAYRSGFSPKFLLVIETLTVWTLPVYQFNKIFTEK